MNTVVIPALNEELTVGDVVRGVRGALAARGLDAEVIVVDGGSTDATTRQAELAGARVLRLPGAGKGLCVREGIAAARGDTLVLMDSDGQDVPAELPALLGAYRSAGADFVNGSRFLGTFLDQGISPIDRWGNRALTGLANLLCGSHLSDINASYRVIRRAAIEGIRWDFTEFEIESEMILKATRAGLQVLEVPVTRQRRLGGIRKFQKVRHGLRILRTILSVSLLWRPPAR
ncbi:MAG TPA: glycosyltransferase family 2 protein [Patescibacteria group bacterium]|jgi:glycosyltransferase involved in cell wall biosynthesis|nr:glycosyltransferase family 2 protein [Patescibacteria group bacterium]